jgi:hypothetical protein
MLIYATDVKCPSCKGKKIVMSTNSFEMICRDCGERRLNYSFEQEYLKDLTVNSLYAYKRDRMEVA